LKKKNIITNIITKPNRGNIQKNPIPHIPGPQTPPLFAPDQRNIRLVPTTKNNPSKTANRIKGFQLA